MDEQTTNEVLDEAAIRVFDLLPSPPCTSVYVRNCAEDHGVALHVDGCPENGQVRLTAAMARAIAAWLLECAEVAESMVG